MKRDWLLPFGFKRVGWAILIPAALLGLAMWFDGFAGLPDWLCPEGSRAGKLLHTETADRIFHNIALTVYDLAYLEVMVANLVALPLIFLLIQRLMLRRIRKEAGDEE